MVGPGNHEYPHYPTLSTLPSNQHTLPITLTHSLAQSLTLTSTLPWMVGPGNHELEVVVDGSVVPLTMSSQTAQSNPTARTMLSQRANSNVATVATTIAASTTASTTSAATAAAVNLTSSVSVTHIFTAFESRYRMPWVRPAELGSVSFSPGPGGGSPWTPTPSEPEPPCGSSVFLAEYEYGNSYYSFEAGQVHVIFLNPYAASHMLSPQYQVILLTTAFTEYNYYTHHVT